MFNNSNNGVSKSYYRRKEFKDTQHIFNRYYAYGLFLGGLEMKKKIRKPSTFKGKVNERRKQNGNR